MPARPARALRSAAPPASAEVGAAGETSKVGQQYREARRAPGSRRAATPGRGKLWALPRTPRWRVREAGGAGARWPAGWRRRPLLPPAPASPGRAAAAPRRASGTEKTRKRRGGSAAGRRQAPPPGARPAPAAALHEKAGPAPAPAAQRAGPPAGPPAAPARPAAPAGAPARGSPGCPPRPGAWIAEVRRPAAGASGWSEAVRGGSRGRIFSRPDGGPRAGGGLSKRGGIGVLQPWP